MTAPMFKSFEAPKVNRREIIRYMGAKELSAEQEALLDECLAEILPKLTYNVCWVETSVSTNEEGVCFDFAAFKSKGLKRNLDRCDKAVIFAATIGLDIDRCISKYSRLSPVKGLMMQAIGAERIESLCNVFNLEVESWANENEKRLRPRFSPGYGDFALEAQKELFRVLDCSRKIGLTLNSSFLMSPSKSVTAIIGITDCRENFYKESCAACNKADCAFKKL